MATPYPRSLFLVVTIVFADFFSSHVANAAETHGVGGYLYLGDAEAPYVTEFYERGEILPNRRRRGKAGHRDNDDYPAEFASVREEGEDYKPRFLFHRDNGARVVVFYAGWCGHCKAYAPRFAEQARDVLSETRNTDEFRFYAVSCAHHKLLCRMNKVKGYPTVLVFGKGSVRGVPYPRAHRITADRLRRVIRREEIPPDETDDVRAAEKKRRDRYGEFVRNMGTPTATTSDENQKRRRRRREDEEEESVRRQRDVFRDAYLSLRATLADGVYDGEGPLPDDRRRVLTEWLTLLDLTTPTGWTDARDLVNNLSARTDVVSRSERDLTDLLSSSSSSSIEPGVWSSRCGEGYTCGLWSLFHVSTVGTVERRAKVSTERVADAIRDVVAHFFGCEECVRHFVGAYDGCENRRCEVLDQTVDVDNVRRREELALWLWRTHNNVNLRLRKEKEGTASELATKQEMQEAYWPSQEDCPECWNDVVNGEEVYRVDAVYVYLKKTYWPYDDSVFRPLAETDVKTNVDTNRSLLKRKRNTRSSLHGAFRSYFPLLLCFGGASFYIYKRRKEFRSKGMHKKDDGDGSASFFVL